MAEVILALDVPTARQAFDLLDRAPDVAWVKVGSVLFTSEGPELVRDLKRRGLQIFLDLKWHDIPNTVASAVEAARALGVAMATVHTLGGIEMLRAAETAAGGALGLVGVTVLTSHGAEGYSRTVGRPNVDLDTEVDRLARSARDAGLKGIVCSPKESAAMRALLGPSAWIVVPGIRRSTDAAGDQTRTAAPGDAARTGASHLVVGRPILQAPDPAAVYREMAQEARCEA